MNGAVPLFVGTLMISGIAMLIAVPVGLLSAIYLAEYANRRFRSWAKPLLEVLAGIPTVTVKDEDQGRGTQMHPPAARCRSP